VGGDEGEVVAGRGLVGCAEARRGDIVLERSLRALGDPLRPDGPVVVVVVVGVEDSVDPGAAGDGVAGFVADAGEAVVGVDVPVSVGVALDEVGGAGDDGEIAAVRAGDGGPPGIEVGGIAHTVHRDEAELVDLIVEEDGLKSADRAAVGLEGDDLAVATDGRPHAIPAQNDSVLIERIADPRGRGRGAVVAVDVPIVIGVAADDIRGLGVVGDVAAVSADGGAPTVAVDALVMVVGRPGVADAGDARPELKDSINFLDSVFR